MILVYLTVYEDGKPTTYRYPDGWTAQLAPGADTLEIRNSERRVVAQWDRPHVLGWEERT